jgi:hypothetical protein
LAQHLHGTPDATTAVCVGVGYVRQWEPGYQHSQVRLANKVSAVTFWAKGVSGDENWKVVPYVS